MTVENRIRDLAGRCFPGSTVGDVWPLKGGISATMTAFRLHNDGQTETLCLRQVSAWTLEHNALAATHEYLLLEELTWQGLPVPRPRVLDQEGNQYVIGFIEGEPDLKPVDLSDHLRRYAAQLATIHRSSITNLDFLQKQTLLPITSPEEQNVRLGEPEIRAKLAEIQPDVGLNMPVLRHGDYWPGNVLWKDGSITGVIDWEGAMIGEPLADLAVARLDVLWVHGEAAMLDFTEYYHEAMSLDRVSQPYWDLRASIRCINDFERMAPAYPLIGREDVTVKTLEDGVAVFIEQALRSL